MAALEWVDSPNKQDGYEPEKELRGRLQAMKAAEWVESHPDEFEELCGIVAGLPADHLRDRANLECIRRGIKVTEAHNAASFAHAMWAPLVRYMVLVHPELAGNPVTFSTACVDYSGLPAVSAMGVRR